MLSANRCRYSRGLRRIINNEEHKGTRSRILFQILRELRVLRGWIDQSLRAFFKSGGLAAQMSENFSGEMERTGD
jgi:hypothetical protein